MTIFNSYVKLPEGTVCRGHQMAEVVQGELVFLLI